jgi:hypothetical protein
MLYQRWYNSQPLQSYYWKFRMFSQFYLITYASCCSKLPPAFSNHNLSCFTTGLAAFHMLLASFHMRAAASKIRRRSLSLSGIWGSHGSEYENECLLGCCTLWSGRSLPTFQRCLLPPSSGRSWWRNKHLWKVGEVLPDYKAQQLRWQPSSSSSAACDFSWYIPTPSFRPITRNKSRESEICWEGRQAMLSSSTSPTVFWAGRQALLSSSTSTIFLAFSQFSAIRRSPTQATRLHFDQEKSRLHFIHGESSSRRGRAGGRSAITNWRFDQ